MDVMMEPLPAKSPSWRKDASRVVIYSHDTFGLGHLRRSRAIANAIVEECPSTSVVIISGSPVIGNFEFGSGVDYIRIPGVTKLPDGDYRSLNLNVELDEAVGLREALILQAVKSFRPDVFIVDKEPTGFRGEVIPALGLSPAGGMPPGSGHSRRHGRARAAVARMGTQGGSPGPDPLL